MHPQNWMQSGAVPETPRNPNRENQEPNEDQSQNDPHIEVGTSINRSLQKLDPDEASYR